MVHHRTVIHFYWESFSDFHTNKRSTQFSWWRQRGPPTSLLNRFLRLSRERSTTTMCNFPFIFWWWSGMNQEWKFFRQFSKWVSIPCQLPFLCWSSFSLSYDEICSTYLPQNSSACSSSFENWSNWLKASSVFWVKNKVGLPKMHRAVQKLQIESWYHRISSIAKTPLLILVVGSQ